MELKVDPKICGVCGDKALGYNFNAVTCESCKAFFRRNALAKKVFRCPFSDQCEITTVTRRFCQKCRLQKCFAIGMKKEYIMSEEEKVRKREKIEQNRAKKRTSGSGFKSSFKKVKREVNQEEDSQDYAENDLDYNNSKENLDDTYTNGHTNIISVINYNSSDISKIPPADESNSFNPEFIASPQSSDTVQDESMIRSMLNPTPNGSVHNSEGEGSPLSTFVNNNDSHCNHNIAGTSTSRSNTSTTDAAKDIMEEIQRTPVEAHSIESILCEAIKLEYEAYTSLANCHSNSRELNDAERAKLNELIVANKALLTPLDDELSTLISEDCRFKSNPQQILQTDPALVDVINLTAIAIRRLIKMAKKINAFKNMCQEDQVALLKGGCTEMLTLRSAMNYDPTKQHWRIPSSQDSLSLNVDVLKLAKGKLHQEYERFIKTFDPKWRIDENIILILCAITLFSPDRPRVIHQDVIKLEQNSYYYLLRRYLESVYPGCEAKSMFLKLIQKIADLHKFNEEIVNAYLDVNPSEVEPLLIEIFDLKH